MNAPPRRSTGYWTGLGGAVPDRPIVSLRYQQHRPPICAAYQTPKKRPPLSLAPCALVPAPGFFQTPARVGALARTVLEGKAPVPPCTAASAPPTLKMDPAPNTSISLPDTSSPLHTHLVPQAPPCPSPCATDPPPLARTAGFSGLTPSSCPDLQPPLLMHLSCTT